MIAIHIPYVRPKQGIMQNSYSCFRSMIYDPASYCPGVPYSMPPCSRTPVCFDGRKRGPLGNAVGGVRGSGCWRRRKIMSRNGIVNQEPVVAPYHRPHDRNTDKHTSSLRSQPQSHPASPTPDPLVDGPSAAPPPQQQQHPSSPHSSPHNYSHPSAQSSTSDYTHPAA